MQPPGTERWPGEVAGPLGDGGQALSAALCGPAVAQLPAGAAALGRGPRRWGRSPRARATSARLTLAPGRCPRAASTRNSVRRVLQVGDRDRGALASSATCPAASKARARGTPSPPRAGVQGLLDPGPAAVGVLRASGVHLGQGAASPARSSSAQRATLCSKRGPARPATRPRHHPGRGRRSPGLAVPRSSSVGGHRRRDPCTRIPAAGPTSWNPILALPRPGTVAATR